MGRRGSELEEEVMRKEWRCVVVCLSGVTAFFQVPFFKSSVPLFGRGPYPQAWRKALVRGKSLIIASGSDLWPQVEISLREGRKVNNLFTARQKVNQEPRKI